MLIDFRVEEILTLFLVCLGKIPIICGECNSRGSLRILKAFSSDASRFMKRQVMAKTRLGKQQITSAAPFTFLDIISKVIWLLTDTLYSVTCQTKHLECNKITSPLFCAILKRRIQNMTIASLTISSRAQVCNSVSNLVLKRSSM